MTFRSCSLVIAALLACSLPVNAQSANNYIRSVEGAPWGQNTNEDSMDAVFGFGQWSDLRYESVNPATLFTPATRFIFMEGGDFTADSLTMFLLNNGPIIHNWVNGGGRLFLNAAPNEGGNIPTPFPGTTIVYPDFSVDPTFAADPSHPIFNGPFVPVTTSYSGSAFAHATVTNPGTPLILSGNGQLIHLSEQKIGAGLLLIGGLTTDNFHSPQPEAHNLRSNIIDYAASVSLGPPPLVYCTAKTNSLGCVPAIAPFGAPSAVATSGFLVLGTNVRNQKPGVLLYSLDGRDLKPFQGGFLCVAAPIRRTHVLDSGGSHYIIKDCSGAWRLDMNAFAAGVGGGKPAAGLHRPGSSVHCQWWGRDPLDPFGSALTDALQYEIAP